MTGTEHYLEAERLIVEDQIHRPPTRGNIELAQVHATLALAAAVAMTGHGPGEMAAPDFEAWDKACGTDA